MGRPGLPALYRPGRVLGLLCGAGGSALAYFALTRAFGG
jgi:hypothetical protein